MSEQRGPEIEPKTDRELVVGFRKGDESGSRLIRRIFEKAERDPELCDQPLPGFEGLKVADYFTVAGRHGDAERMLLGFLLLDEASPQFPQAQQGMGAMIDSRMAPPAQPHSQ